MIKNIKFNGDSISCDVDGSIDIVSLNKIIDNLRQNAIDQKQSEMLAVLRNQIIRRFHLPELIVGTATENIGKNKTGWVRTYGRAGEELQSELEAAEDIPLMGLVQMLPDGRVARAGSSNWVSYQPLALGDRPYFIPKQKTKIFNAEDFLR